MIQPYKEKREPFRNLERIPLFFCPESIRTAVYRITAGDPSGAENRSSGHTKEAAADGGPDPAGDLPEA